MQTAIMDVDHVMSQSMTDVNHVTASMTLSVLMEPLALDPAILISRRLMVCSTISMA